MVAVSLTMLLIAAAMVLDFGTVRLDRQKARLATDAAAIAGLHAGDGGTGQLFTQRAVCGALEFLRANEPSLSGLAACPYSSTSSTICSTTALAATTATYTDTWTEDGITSTVKIKAPYSVTEDGYATKESSTTSLVGDTGSGCDQIGVVVTRSRKPGLGSLATSGDLAYRLRSVGRVETGRGDDAPAFLLLERENCRALDLSSGGSGSGSHIYVRGYGPTPGTIHSDSTATGSNCGTGSNEQLILGKQTAGIVAFGGTTGATGVISSVATANGVGDTTVFDTVDNVFGTTAAYPSTGGTHSKVRGRGLVTRSIVDGQYRSGVAAAIAAAATDTANPATPGTPWSMTYAAAGAPLSGWRRVTCTGGGSDLATNLAAMTPALTSTDKLFIECDPGSGISIGTAAAPIRIDAGKVFVNGWIGGGNLRFPNATRIWINNPSNKAAAISLSSNTGFCMRGTSTTCTESSPFVSGCSTASSESITTHGQLFIRQGRIEMGAGLLRLCSTTAFLLGGDAAKGCVPTTTGPAPTTTPCPGLTGGTGQINTTGGQFDWLAPNDFAGVIPAASQTAAWDAQEDLALWAESYGGSTGSNRFKMAGGAGMNTRGVFMVPNANPFNITGGGNQTLTNAQYISRRFSLDGGATLEMSVDPNNAITLPKLSPFYLVR